MKWNELVSDDTRCSIPDLCSLGRCFSRHQQNSPEKQPWVLDAEVRGRVRLGERPDLVPISISRSFTTDLRRSRTGTHLCTADPGGTGMQISEENNFHYILIRGKLLSWPQTAAYAGSTHRCWTWLASIGHAVSGTVCAGSNLQYASSGGTSFAKHVIYFSQANLISLGNQQEPKASWKFIS